MGDLTGHTISEAYIKYCGFWPMLPIVKLHIKINNTPLETWPFLTKFTVKLAKFCSFQDKISKFYVQFGHRSKCNFAKTLSKTITF
jgi:hypothetical protein